MKTLEKDEHGFDDWKTLGNRKKERFFFVAIE